MPHRSKVTTDHETIRAWAEERGGRPTRVSSKTEDGADLLRIDFAEPDAELKPITWDEFFDVFEEHRLAFLYQDETEEGEESRFCKFVYRSEDSLRGSAGSGKKKGLADEEEDPDEDGEDELEEEEDEGYDADPDEPEEM
jgi:hypothetical protein